LTAWVAVKRHQRGCVPLLSQYCIAVESLRVQEFRRHEAFVSSTSRKFMAVTNYSELRSLICISGDDTYGCAITVKPLAAHRELVATAVTIGWCSMTLTPWDMFVIQTAIDRYEKAFPDEPSPSVAEALEWNANQSRRVLRSNGRGPTGDRRQSLWSRASESILTWWQTSAPRRAREL
jgi:hypothetical protein